MAKTKKKVEDTIKNLSFESAYEIDSSFDNERFIRLKCRIMHDGLNPNFSNFSLEAIEKAKSTLSNIPILANVVEDEEGNLDFGAHDLAIEEGKDGELRLIYKELPIGLIPETNDYNIEEYEGRNYVTCYGYIWRGYSNLAEEIIENKENIKLSMEIMVDEYSVLEDDKDYFDIKDYKYTGITLLGDKYGTGMLDAKAEKVAFNMDEQKETFIKMAQELKFALEQNTPEYTLEDGKEGNLEQESLNNPLEDSKAEESTNEGIVEPVVEGEKFSLTANEKKEILNKALPSDNSENSHTYYYVMDFDDNYVYLSIDYYGEDESKYYYARCKYSFDGSVAVVDKSSMEQIYTKWLTADEMAKIDEERNKMVMELQAEKDNLEKELISFKTEVESKNKLITELQEFKNRVELEIKQSAVNELIEDFSDILKDNDEFVELKKKSMKMEIADLEKELYALEGKLKHEKKNKKEKKFNFSKVVPNEVSKSDASAYYGSASKYLVK